MIRVRILCAPLAALFVAACAEDTPTSLPVDPLDSAESLELVVPSLSPDQLVAMTEEGSAASADGPSAVTTSEEPPSPEYSDIDVSGYLDEVGTIWDPYTKVGFGPGYGFSYGEHKYQGNKGRVETTVSVSYNDAPLGSQTAVREKYDIFLLDAGALHFVSATARFYTDKTCGLTVRGSSLHQAWWEWFLGGHATSWGRAIETSGAPAEYQGECPVQPAGGGGGGDDAVCYLWIEYDLETGEVYDVSVLYCTVGG